MRLRINGAFAGQTITGQQRYASEVSKRLGMLSPDRVQERLPAPWWSRSAVRAWLWAQQVGFGRWPDEVLLTLTSRGPLIARLHVIVVHDLFVFTHPQWFSKKYAWTHIPVLWLQMFTAKTIIAVSEPVAEQIRVLTKGRKHVFVAPNAPAEVFLDSPQGDEQLNPVLTKFKLARGQFVLAVGSLDPRKNLEALVQAHQLLPLQLRLSYPLVIVGAPSMAFGHVDLSEDVATRMLGYVSDEELAVLYAGSRLVVFPTLDEGFGLPAAEALAAGARLLVSDIPVMHWVCEDFAAYVHPTSPAEIADGLKRQLESAVDSEATRSGRRAYIRRRFSWDRTAEAILQNLHTPAVLRDVSKTGSDSH